MHHICALRIKFSARILADKPLNSLDALNWGDFPDSRVLVWYGMFIASCALIATFALKRRVAS
ncbi:MAG TPA: hypothetical protein DDW55_00510 [Gammaproteobacteria bacterium]|nr:hypothetical protein [Gammaproteobacteria bacterium]